MLAIKIIVYATMLVAVLGVLSSALSNTSEELGVSVKEFDSELEASNCASIIDSFYANSGGSLNDLKIDCYLKEENIVASNSNGIEKTAFILNNSTKSSPESNYFKVEIKVRDRYEK